MSTGLTGIMHMPKVAQQWIPDIRQTNVRNKTWEHTTQNSETYTSELEAGSTAS